MEWAKIEIEFPPTSHDVNEVMQFLADYFRHESGVPTATITLVGVGVEDEEGGDKPWLTGSGAYQQVSWPNGRPPSSLKKGAEQVATLLPYHKIQAIKQMRVAYNIGLKEAKDFIDAAFQDLGL